MSFLLTCREALCFLKTLKTRWSEIYILPLSGISGLTKCYECGYLEEGHDGIGKKTNVFKLKIVLSFIKSLPTKL